MPGYSVGGPVQSPRDPGARPLAQRHMSVDALGLVPLPSFSRGCHVTLDVRAMDVEVLVVDATMRVLTCEQGSLWTVQETVDLWAVGRGLRRAHAWTPPLTRIGITAAGWPVGSRTSEADFAP